MRVDGAQSTTAATVDTKEQKKLKEACRDFEAIFLNFLLKSMRKTVQKSELLESSGDNEFFQEMMDSEVCKAAAHTNSMGLADTLYRQLSAEGASAGKSDNGEERGGNQ